MDSNWASCTRKELYSTIISLSSSSITKSNGEQRAILHRYTIYLSSSPPLPLLSPLLRQTESKYRIVAFEVDPRSVSQESLKAAPDANKEKDQLGPGDKCVYPSEVSVMELKKKSELA